MDNLTHTLIGVLAGDTLARSVPATQHGLSSDSRRGLFVTVMAVGSNFPDLDLVQSALNSGKLNYLLEHRGYTHTAVGAFVIAVLMFAVCEAWIRFRGLPAAHADRFALFGVALLAPLLHIAMDFSNSYGVHPFWPFYNGWLYGDSVFIVEPLFWAAAAPLVFILKSLFARAVVALSLVAGIVVSAVSGMVPTPLVIVLALLMTGMLAVGYYAAPRKALLAGVVVWIATTMIFVSAGRAANAQIETLHRRTGSEQLLDSILTPMPANPICWDVLQVRSIGEAYSLRQATFSLAPAWLPANACPSRGFAQEITAPVVPIEEPDTPSLHWRGQVRLSKRALRDLNAQSCEAAALMHFARAPFYVRRSGMTIVGDLRYDREPQPGFAEIEIGTAPCPSAIPPWTPPRADLLRPTTEFGRSSPRK
jgi:inner membrane protein